MKNYQSGYKDQADIAAENVKRQEHEAAEAQSDMQGNLAMKGKPPKFICSIEKKVWCKVVGAERVNPPGTWDLKFSCLPDEEKMKEDAEKMSEKSEEAEKENAADEKEKKAAQGDKDLLKKQTEAAKKLEVNE